MGKIQVVKLNQELCTKSNVDDNEVLFIRVSALVEDKNAMLLRNNVAVWDVIASCDIEGSADSTIRNVVPNDIRPILEKADIEQIYVNGRKAEELYKKYIEKNIDRHAICLPSTSPANAAWKLERLIEAWSVINCRYI